MQSESVWDLFECQPCGMPDLIRFTLSFCPDHKWRLFEWQRQTYFLDGGMGWGQHCADTDCSA